MPLLLFCTVAAIGQTTREEKTFTLDFGEAGKLTMVWCPPGTFQMGSPEGEADRAKTGETQHKVTLTKGFWIASTETTQALFQLVTGNRRGKFAGPMLPVTGITYDEAVDFCTKLTELARTKDPSCPAFRMPTEAEWEYACRAGTTTAYAFGDELTPEQACFKTAAVTPQPKPVGSFPPNAWGIYDMHGNGYEMCSDFYADFGPEAATDPTGPTTGTKRVIRGGAFPLAVNNCRSARRTGVPLNAKDPDRTIRVAASQ